MEILAFGSDRKAPRSITIDQCPDDGFVWIDVTRDAAEGLVETVEKVTGCRIFDLHREDALNGDHPSSFESTEHYEVLIFRGLTQSGQAQPLASYAAAFLLFDRALITVRPAGEDSPLIAFRERLLKGAHRPPQRPAGLLHALLSSIVDRFLRLRDGLGAQLSDWQTRLLDPADPFDDWVIVLRHKSDLRRIESLCEGQDEVLTRWSEETRADFDASLQVRYNDLREHVRRVLTYSQYLQSQIESLVQIHFSAAAHRTNEIVRVLTVISAIFLPLTFVAGVFGMNFQNLPGANSDSGVVIVLLAMGAVAGILLWVFRRRRWL